MLYVRNSHKDKATLIIEKLCFILINIVRDACITIYRIILRSAAIKVKPNLSSDLTHNDIEIHIQKFDYQNYQMLF